MQTTIKKSILLAGRGVHTGDTCHIAIHPASENSGFNFIRVDLPKQPKVHATVKNIFSTLGSTTIGNKQVQVKTTEHLLAALWGLGIDNALIEINGPEVPIFDGSALVFTNAIIKSGIQELKSPKRILKITKPFLLHWQKSLAIFTPHLGLSITCHCPIGNKIQHAHINFTSERFLYDIAHARTFVEKSALLPMQKMGLLKGADLSSGILLEHGIPVNINLRMPNECAGHKILDFIGDFALMGMQLQGKIELFNNNHSFHRILLQHFINKH